MTMPEQTALTLLIAVGDLERHMQAKIAEIIDALPEDQRRPAVTALQTIQAGIDETSNRIRSDLIDEWADQADRAEAASSLTIEIDPASIPKPWSRYREPDPTDDKPPSVLDLSTEVDDNGDDDSTTTRAGFE